MREFIEKLIGRLNENTVMMANSKKFWDNPQNGEYASEMIQIKDVVSIINELAEEYKLLENIEQLNNGWIACSERLPSIEERVLLWVYGKVCIGKRIDAKMFEKYDIFSLESGANESTKRIIAWQPLPALYKEGE